MRLALISLCCATLAVSSPAGAATCLEAVDDLSERLGFDTTLPAPDTTDSSREMARRLQSSGGVLAPPDVGAPVAIGPPEPNGGMDTAPPIAGDPSDPKAARLAQIQSLLTAARRAGQVGDDSQCAQRLAQATQLADASDGR